MSSKLDVTWIGGDLAGGNTSITLADALPGKKSTVWKTDDPRNIRKVYVMSYNHLAKHYGPQAFWKSVSNDIPKFCRERGYSEASFNFHNVKDNTAKLPTSAPAGWMRSLDGVFACVFADESQDCLRNQSSMWRAVSWLNPLTTVLMSGYPAPRGMEDYGTYLKLLEDPALRKQHEALEDDLLDGPDTPELEYYPGITNPYLLPDDSP